MIKLDTISTDSPLITEDIKQGLSDVLKKLENPICIKSVIDIDSDKGKELATFLKTFSSLSDKIILELYELSEAPQELNTKYLPVTGLYKDNIYSGASFHGIPGGQEINSFLVAIYNLSGPGQDISNGQKRKIEKINKKINFKICVSLGCHHCPKLVVACQKIAIMNPNIEAQMIDASLYPDLIEQYKIERVPFLIVNNQKTFMGVKVIDELIDIMHKAPEYTD